MKKRTGILFLLISIWLSFSNIITGQTLKFSPRGEFKIVQFTDTHFRFGSVRSDSVITTIETVINAEKPDLVVFTGDVVTWNNTRKGWLKLMQPVIDAHIPWAVTLGNHDQEFDLTREQVLEILETLPYSLSKRGPKNVSGSGNYVLHIKASASDKTTALLYCFDSHAYPTQDIGKYDWIKFSQVQWYRTESEAYTKSNNNHPIPALAFFHIPFPEYKEIADDPKTIGFYGEEVCCPEINTGLFAAMYESKDVMGVFVGHDHSNNYAGCLHDICLIYGSVTGRECHTKTNRGYRIIKLYEEKRRFDTWVVTDDGQKKYFVTYPDSFQERK